MRVIRAATILALFLTHLCSAACIPFEQARNHLGEIQCVTGKVIRVEDGGEGIRYLQFCEDENFCTFSVVVFPYDLRKLGDVRQLAGKTIAIRGEVKESDSGAEIILENLKQLGSEPIHLSPLPKNFDVEERGHFSPGSPRRPRKRYTRKKRGVATLPAEIPEDPESE